VSDTKAAEGQRADYAFARRRRWILSHILVVLLVVVMVNLGFWQLRRLDEKKDRNALITARMDEPVAPIDEILDQGDTSDVGADVRFRRATAIGTYDVADQVLVRNRSFDGAAGSWVLTPLVLDDGTALVVNRGWVPVVADEVLSPDAAPPTGTVSVEGLVEQTEERGRFGPTDPAGGRLDVLSRVDVARYQHQVDLHLYPVWLQLTDQDPEAGDIPTLLRPPELSEGPHLSYAVQWFIFSTIAVIGYPLILRRRARSGEP
jgi:surfeit locus 1 family protein